MPRVGLEGRRELSWVGGWGRVDRAARRGIEHLQLRGEPTRAQRDRVRRQPLAMGARGAHAVA